MKLKFANLGAVVLTAALTGSTPSISAQAASVHAGINAVLAECLNQTPDEAKSKSVKTPGEASSASGQQADTKQTKTEQPETQQAKTEPSATGTAETKNTKKICGYTNLGIANVDQHLNIREAADESAKIIGKLPAGAGCEVLETADSWYHIRSGSVDGYVKGDYIITGAKAEKLARKYQKNIATVKAQTVYIREKPAADCAILTIVTAGEELQVEPEEDAGNKTVGTASQTVKTSGGTDQNWVRIRLDDEIGYVNAKYVTISKELKKAAACTEISSDGISEARYQLVQTAFSCVGGRYAADGSDLSGSGVDSAGFTMQLLSDHAVYLPHSARKQAGIGTDVNTSELLPGDLIFYGIGNTISHVGLYIGNGQIIHASNPRDGIKISDMFYRTPICCRRML